MQFLVCLYFKKARNNFESTRAEVERLMKRIRSAEEDFKAPSCFTMEGYLYIQEKREIHKNHIFSVSFPHLCCEENQMPELKHIHAQGHLQENVSCNTGPLGSVWTRYYCTYEKSSKMFTMSNTEVRPASRQVSCLHRWTTTLMLFSVLAHFFKNHDTVTAAMSGATWDGPKCRW